MRTIDSSSRLRTSIPSAPPSNAEATATEPMFWLDGLDIPVVLDRAVGTWVWRAVLGREVVATCTHTYLRRVECARSLAQFRDAMARAAPGDGIVRFFGPRSLAAFSTAPAGAPSC